MPINLSAPKISSIRLQLRDRNISFGQKTQNIIDNIFSLSKKIEAIKDDEDIRSIWIKIPRGEIEDFGDYHSMKEEGEVEDFNDFENYWKDSYPSKEIWYKLWIIQSKDFRSIILDSERIYEKPCTHLDYRECVVEEEYLDFFYTIQNELKSALDRVSNNTYQDDVNNNLPLTKRWGTITRKDYWEFFPQYKEREFEDITKEEISLFLKNIKDQTEKNEVVGEYIKEMTSGIFYQYNSLCYKVNNYNNIEGKTPKEQYLIFSDGRDAGLRDIDENSTKEFSDWYKTHDRTGHIWEINCRSYGGTIFFFVCHNEKGYYFSISGSDSISYIQAIKFYNALRKTNVAVYLNFADVYINRIEEKDKIGIVPFSVFSRYAHDWFDDPLVRDCIHLPDENSEKEELDKILTKIKWIKEEEVKLISKS